MGRKRTCTYEDLMAAKHLSPYQRALCEKIELRCYVEDHKHGWSGSVTRIHRDDRGVPISVDLATALGRRTVDIRDIDLYEPWSADSYITREDIEDYDPDLQRYYATHEPEFDEDEEEDAV